MTEDTPSLCDESRMREILTQADADSMKGVLAIDKALAEHPQDPRLHFLKGSLFIGLKRLVEAHDSLARAVAIAPEFALARFQLGFFELTSGEADAALETWGPLRNLPDGHWMLSPKGGHRQQYRELSPQSRHAADNCQMRRIAW
jgi:hypothetical protein